MKRSNTTGSSPRQTTKSGRKGNTSRWNLDTPPPTVRVSHEPHWVGQQFGWVTVISPEVRTTTNGHRYVAVRCDGCGETQWSYFHHLKTGHSMGCQQCSQPVRIPAWLKRIANDAKQRCENPNHRNFPNYGKRGIEFRFPSVLEAGLWILANLGERPKDMQIDRRDNNRHYEPGNLRWATPHDNSMNRRNTRFMDFRGSKVPIEHALHVLRHMRPKCRYADQTLRRFLAEASSIEEVLERVDKPPRSCKPIGLYGIFSTPDPEIVSLYPVG